MQKIINFLNKRKICYIFIFAMIVCFFVSKVILQSFVILEAVKSINIFSKNASYKDSEPGSWKVSKSASWIDDGKARITINVDTISKNTNKEYKDVIIVLDISNTMKEDKLNKVKDATSNLVNSVLSDSNNKIALISSDVSELTNDKNLLINYINNLSGKDNISYYSSLDKVDDILRGYSKEKNRECIVLFLTDSYPNQGTPNQVGEYQYLEDNYPYVSFNGIQYEMGDRVLTSIKEISQHQYVANKSNLNDILSSFADSSAVYDEFTFIDYIDTNFFYIFSIEEIKAKLGTITLDGNKITWTINNQLISGRSTSMTIDINLKNGYLSKNRTFTTNKEEKIISKISGNVREDVTSNLTPILQNNFLIKYDANTPSDCVVKNNPNDEVGSVFANIKISDEIPMCIGYNFRGWEIITKNVKKINEDYFIMPESDVLLRGVWSKISIKTSMNGTVYEKNIELSSEQEENGSDAIKKDDSKDTDSKKINLNAKLIKQIDSTNIVFGKSLDRNSIASIIFVDSINIPKGTESWDVSDVKNGSIMAWIIKNRNGLYDLYIGQKGGVVANSNSSYLFSKMSNLSRIVGFENFNTSSVIDTSYMFNQCNSLKNLDISKLDFAKVTNSAKMFNNMPSKSNGAKIFVKDNNMQMFVMRSNGIPSDWNEENILYSEDSCYTASAKSGRFIIKEITTKDIERSFVAFDPPCNGGPCLGTQGMTILGDRLILAKNIKGNTDTSISVYNLINGELIRHNHTDSDLLGHANGMTTGPDGKIYVVTSKDKQILAFNLNSDGSISFVTKDGSYDMKVLNYDYRMAAVAYDNYTSMFYLASGDKLRKYNPITNTAGDSINRLCDYTLQDIDAYKGFVLSIESYKDKDAFLNVYRGKDLAYLGTYHFDFGVEVESTHFWNDKLVIASNDTINPEKIDKVFILKKGVIDFNKDCIK